MQLLVTYPNRPHEVPDLWNGPSVSTLEDQWAFKKHKIRPHNFSDRSVCSYLLDEIISVLGANPKLFPSKGNSSYWRDSERGSNFQLYIKSLENCLRMSGYDEDIINAVIPHSQTNYEFHDFAEIYYGMSVCTITTDVIIEELEKLKTLSLHELGEHIQRKLVAP